MEDAICSLPKERAFVLFVRYHRLILVTFSHLMK
jgi:hypothetical protein